MLVTTGAEDKDGGTTTAATEFGHDFGNSFAIHSGDGIAKQIWTQVFDA